jgi:hypothetical protein
VLDARRLQNTNPIKFEYVRGIVIGIRIAEHVFGRGSLAKNFPAWKERLWLFIVNEDDRGQLHMAKHLVLWQHLKVAERWDEAVRQWTAQHVDYVRQLRQCLTHIDDKLMEWTQSGDMPVYIKLFSMASHTLVAGRKNFTDFASRRMLFRGLDVADAAQQVLHTVLQDWHTRCQDHDGPKTYTMNVSTLPSTGFYIKHLGLTFPYPTNKCVACGSACVRICGQCKIAYYCSVQCQKRHWVNGHRETCAQFSRQRLRSSIQQLNMALSDAVISVLLVEEHEQNVQHMA